ncbi:hypothetical protein F4802DRAFT_599716 [Xylaria palmicola]|nr:hypothetical protein F4802DRAFT_599716 [Xylaria palmicola]
MTFAEDQEVIPSKHSNHHSTIGSSSSHLTSELQKAVTPTVELKKGTQAPPILAAIHNSSDILLSCLRVEIAALAIPPESSSTRVLPANTHGRSSDGPTTPSQPSTPRPLGDAYTPGAPTYEGLLDKVIKAARSARLPYKRLHKSLDLFSVQQSLFDLDDDGTAEGYFDGFVGSKWDKNREMGAAGELYVFELLSMLSPSLPNFSRHVWQSRVRHFVAKHSSYKTLEAWNGLETSDIVYTDTAGVLTAALIKHDYLDHAKWNGRCPKYYIEVKTTTEQCDNKFFMNNEQRGMMDKIVENLKDEEGQEAIYVIFRVFNLEKPSISCRIYVNPADGDALLRFTPGYGGKKWQVVPWGL